MAPHLPQRTPAELSWRERWAALRYVRPLVRMVWETSPPLVLASMFFRLIGALMPLAMLWVSKLILDAVVAWISHHNGSVAAIWKLATSRSSPR